jgi:hypothetical protein
MDKERMPESVLVGNNMSRTPQFSAGWSHDLLKAEQYVPAQAYGQEKTGIFMLVMQDHSCQ